MLTLKPLLLVGLGQAYQVSIKVGETCQRNFLVIQNERLIGLKENRKTYFLIQYIKNQVKYSIAFV